MMKLSISKKFAKRSIKCLALFAPLAYLFGSLFFGLNGSHGTQLWAEPVYTEQWVEVDNYVQDGSSYRLEISDNYQGWISNIDFSYRIFTFNYDFNGATRSYWSMGFYESRYYFCIYPTTSGDQYQFFRYDPATSDLTLSISFPWVLISDSFPTDFINIFDGYSTLKKSVSVPTENVPENNSAFTDFTFGQFFAKDNFLQKWGENAISDNPIGFAPFGTFLKFMNDNVFHFDQSQIGLMAYGYFYYCCHVLIAFLAFDIVAFIPLIVERISDKLGGKEDD